MGRMIAGIFFIVLAAALGTYSVIMIKKGRSDAQGLPAVALSAVVLLMLGIGLVAMPGTETDIHIPVPDILRP